MADEKRTEELKRAISSNIRKAHIIVDMIRRDAFPNDSFDTRRDAENKLKEILGALDEVFSGIGSEYRSKEAHLQRLPLNQRL